MSATSIQHGRIPDASIKLAKADIVGTISKYLDLKKAGKDYSALCPFHPERTPSFTVSESKGFYHCYGCGAHGDSIDFVMNHENVSFHAAIESIVGNLQAGGSSPRKHQTDKQATEEQWNPVTPVPADAPRPPISLGFARKPNAVWMYADADGNLIGYIRRLDKPGGGKTIMPLTYCVNTRTGEFAWKPRAFGGPRPLFGLDKLAKHPDAQVMVVEGEKATDAAQALFEALRISLDKIVVITWPGGAGGVRHVDWTPLHGRSVGLWPDADDAGTKAMLEVGRQLKDHIVGDMLKVFNLPEGVDKGWDLADELPDGFDLLAHIKAEHGKMLFSQFENNVVGAAGKALQAEPADEPLAVVDASTQTQTHRGNRKAAPKRKNSKEFGEPIDLFGVSLPPQVPLSALPASIAAYAKDQSSLLGSDHSIIAMTSLVAAAACITDGIKLQPKRMDPTWTESARLWVGVVGDPSTKKSPSISKSVRHVKRLEARLAEKNSSAYGDWKIRHEEWKLEKRETKGRNATQEPSAPPMKRLIVEDTTIEALGEVLKDNDRGVLCLQDELTGWFASMDAYKGGGGKGANKDRAHWLEAYNGGPRSIDRISRQSITIPNWSVCMIGGIQPDMMRRIANGMGNDGLLQRFMILVARPSQRGEDRYPDRTAMDQFSALFDHLESLDPAAESVTMSEAAHQARERIEVFADKMIRAFDHPHMQAWLGKWEGLFARLVLLYHVIECAEESIYPTTTQVTGETGAKVERLMCGTLLHHAIYFYQELVDAHDRQSNMRQLARLIVSARGTHLVCFSG